MLNSIPIVGTILDFILKVCMAIPFWFIWTVLKIGEKFFYFLPEVYQHIGFWETVGVFMVLGIIKSLSPFYASASSTSTGNKIEK